MARRKKYQKLPNGYGQIRYLGNDRPALMRQVKNI